MLILALICCALVLTSLLATFTYWCYGRLVERRKYGRFV